MRTLGSAGPKAERTSFDDLYVRSISGARTTAYLMTGDRMLAEDLAQEAFIRVMGRFGNLRAPEAFDAYLRRTVVRLTLNHFRRRKLERRNISRSIPETGQSRDVAGEQDLWRQLGHLPPRQRAALVLRFYEDLSERQVGEVLGCSNTAVRSLVAHGLRTLRGRMGGDEA